MNCREFLDRYSEFLDGELDSAGEAVFRRHVEGCPSCARYDDVVRRGVSCLCELEPVEPGRPARLLEVIREAESRPVPRAAAVGALGALAIAGVLAAIAWSPLLQDLRADLGAVRDGVSQRPAQAADATGRVAVPGGRALLDGPVDPTPFQPSSFPAEPFEAAAPDLGAVAPGPYSPLPLEPPDFGRPSVLHDASAVYSHPIE